MVSCPEKSDVSFDRKSKMAAGKTEAAITFERLEITTRFQLMPHIFDQVRLGYDTVNIVRYFLTSADYTEFKMAATETESGKTIERNQLVAQFQRLPIHLRPCWTRPWHSRHCPTLADLRKSSWRPLNRKWKSLLNGERWGHEFNFYPHIFVHVLLGYDSIVFVRRQLTVETVSAFDVSIVFQVPSCDDSWSFFEHQLKDSTG